MYEFCLLLFVVVGRYWFFFFFNDTATTEIYTLSLHDALPICAQAESRWFLNLHFAHELGIGRVRARSEEHTSELQSRLHLVCRLLLEKKKMRSSSSRPI